MPDVSKQVFCKDCKAWVVPVKKMFGVLLCPKCNRILASDIAWKQG